MSIISVFPGRGKPKLEVGSASPLTYEKTYSPSGDNEGFSSFKVNAMPSGVLAKPSIQQPNANGRVYATAGVSAAGYLSDSAEKENYIDLPTQSADTITPGTSPKLAVSKGKYTTGDVYVEGSASLLPQNIKKGENIFGIDGELDDKYYIGWVDEIVADDSTANEFVVRVSSPGWVVGDRKLCQIFMISQRSQSTGEVAFLNYDFVRQTGTIIFEAETGTGLYRLDENAMDNYMEISCFIVGGSVNSLAVVIDVSSGSDFSDLVESADTYEVYAIFGPSNELPNT